MRGIELSEGFYNEYGAHMIHDMFPELEKFIAVGLAGSGSECFGFDDDISVDHDFEPGFCMFIPGEDIIDDKSAFALERAYSKLPGEYLSYKRNRVSPVGGHRHGVIRISDFLKDKTGDSNGNLTLMDWFAVPEQSLSELVNGKIFRDEYGLFTNIRNKFSYMPNDIMLKKLAANLLIMGQAGQYNYNRCIKRKDTAAAQLAAIEFVKSSIKVIFLLNKTYEPYYKWTFKALKKQKYLSELYDCLEYIISSGNGRVESEAKSDIIEQISSMIIKKLLDNGMTEYMGDSLEEQAYAVNNLIVDNRIRTLHILYGAPS